MRTHALWITITAPWTARPPPPHMLNVNFWMYWNFWNCFDNLSFGINETFFSFTSSSNDAGWPAVQIMCNNLYVCVYMSKSFWVLLIYSVRVYRELQLLFPTCTSCVIIYVLLFMCFPTCTSCVIIYVLLFMCCFTTCAILHFTVLIMCHVIPCTWGHLSQDFSLKELKFIVHF